MLKAKAICEQINYLPFGPRVAAREESDQP